MPGFSYPPVESAGEAVAQKLAFDILLLVGCFTSNSRR